MNPSVPVEKYPIAHQNTRETAHFLQKIFILQKLYIDILHFEEYNVLNQSLGGFVYAHHHLSFPRCTNTFL